MSWTDAQKADAVAVYVEHGLAHAHAETGASKPSLRRWAQEAGHDPAEIAERTNAKSAAQTASASEATRIRWQDRRTGLLDEYGAAAEDFLHAAIDYMEDGKPAYAFQAMKASGTACDKAQLLSGDATSTIRGLPWDSELMDRVKDQARADGEHVRPLRAV